MPAWARQGPHTQRGAAALGELSLSRVVKRSRWWRVSVAYPRLAEHSEEVLLQDRRQRRKRASRKQAVVPPKCFGQNVHRAMNVADIERDLSSDRLGARVGDVLVHVVLHVLA